MRLDKYLTINNLCESRNKAFMYISEGSVKVNGITVIKPSFDVIDSDKIEIHFIEKHYVSRSSKKLLTAIDKFELDFADKSVVDVGASTGGFCEVMLEYGARRIYAVDVGTNQLHPRIASDPKVINLENTNARYMSKDLFAHEIDIVTSDLSFISVKLVLHSIYDILKDGGEFVCLVKPQFEAGPKFVGKNGVVKDVKIHANVAVDVAQFARKVGFSIVGVSFSGLAGESGNKEYLLYMIKNKTVGGITDEKIREVIVRG